MRIFHLFLLFPLHFSYAFATSLSLDYVSILPNHGKDKDFLHLRLSPEKRWGNLWTGYVDYGLGQGDGDWMAGMNVGVRYRLLENVGIGPLAGWLHFDGGDGVNYLGFHYGIDTRLKINDPISIEARYMRGSYISDKVGAPDIEASILSFGFVWDF